MNELDTTMVLHNNLKKDIFLCVKKMDIKSTYIKGCNENQIQSI